MASSSPLSLSKASTTTCYSLLRQLQEIWDEIGESGTERDKMLYQLEQECLGIYKRKVDETRKQKADLNQSLAKVEAEIVQIIAALGDGDSLPRYEPPTGTLKQKMSTISPVLKKLRLIKQNRINEFLELEMQIAQIRNDISDNNQSVSPGGLHIDESNLTIKSLGELKFRFKELVSEKNLRLQKVNSCALEIHELSVIMSLNFKMIMAEIHPKLVDAPDSRSSCVGNETLTRLTSKLNTLREDKHQRLQKLKELGTMLTVLWNIMDTPPEERKEFDHVTCFLSSSEDEVLSDGCLASSVIEQTEAEVERLKALKSSKMKELIIKRQDELEEIYRMVHIDLDSENERKILISLIDSGNVNLSDLLSRMDEKIATVREVAQNRKDILDKVEKWEHAAVEESWLDDYEQDQNRYSAVKGAHKNLKRAEKARLIVNKIPSLVENLILKVKAWEMEKGMPFLYNKASLLQTLEEFNVSRREKEEGKRKSREQKRLQEQLAMEQEAIYGSKPTMKKPLNQSTSGNTNYGTPTNRRIMTPSRHAISGGKERKDSGKFGNVVPVVNYVALPKDDPKG
ncbi:non-motor microtubule binding protein [Lithospermum erythrorhizon]|uniref:Non-motor microtubule binding protein n=1 Tax=Lithospermum erythrorhizon TaxID=34254 RepID=A0AAV3QZX6_LITER